MHSHAQRHKWVYVTGRQNARVWQTWQGYYLRVLSWSSHNISVFWSFTKRSVKRKVKFGEKLFQIKLFICHACHTRFAVFFSLRSCCISSPLSSAFSLLRTRWNKTTKQLIMSVLFSRLTHHDHTPWCFLVFLCHSFNVVKHNTNKLMISLVKVIATLRVFEHTFWDGCKFLWEIQEITRLMSHSYHAVKMQIKPSFFCRAKHYETFD